MKKINFCFSKSLSRRKVLKGVGASLTLPFLSAMTPAFKKSNSRKLSPKRMLGICQNIGFIPSDFFPESKGFDYTLSKSLAPLKSNKKSFTVFSGISLPDVDGGHPADISFLTAARHPGSAGFRNSISLDQLIAEHIGSETRFPSLTLGVNVAKEKRSLSWTRSGALIPCENQAYKLYEKLFIQGSSKEVDEQIQKLLMGQSIMDSLAEDAKAFKKTLGKSDREKVDQFQESVREVEKQMFNSSKWVKKDKPEFPANADKPNQEINSRDYFKQVEFMYSMIHLAFLTDSTRSISLLIDSAESPAINIGSKNLTDNYHRLSHHGQKEDKINQLKSLDIKHIKLLSEFLDKLKVSREEGNSLLDNSMILYGSNLGDAHTHTCTNLPIIFAGGPFKHGSHLMFDKMNNYPLSNLYVSILQALGLQIEKFVSSTGTMKGLETI